MAATVTWERVAYHSHLHALPFVGTVTLIAGLIGALGVRWEFAGLLPFVLIGAGAIVLLGSVASRLCLPPRDSRNAPGPSIGAAHSATATPEPAVVAPPPANPKPDTAELHSGIGRATLAHLTKVEDELWHRWASPPVVSLGSPVVGPVASTAYSPHKAGGFVAFPDKDRDAVVLPTVMGSRQDPRAEWPSGSPSPSSTERTHRSRQRELPVEAAPERRRVDPSDWRALAEEPGTFLSGRGGMLTLDAFDHLEELEAVNPILTHLRASPPAESARPTTSWRATGASPAIRRFCVDCSERLSEFRSWVECRFCRKPLCRECLRESFEGEEAGACMDCRAQRARSYRSETRETPRRTPDSRFGPTANS